jgi:hypothetical protein
MNTFNVINMLLEMLQLIILLITSFLFNNVEYNVCLLVQLQILTIFT